MAPTTCREAALGYFLRMELGEALRNTEFFPKN